MPGVLASARRGARVTLNASYSITDEETAPTACTSGFRLQADGDLETTDGSSVFNDAGDWIVPKGAAGGNYEARSTLNSGTLTSDPSAGAWVALSSDRTWTVVRGGLGTSTANFTLEIRKAGSLIPMGSSDVTLSASVVP